jgi:hypothetical protein
MTTIQTNNIINLYFNISTECGIDILHLSPSYLREKWILHIGTDIENNNITKSVKLDTWTKIWGVTDKNTTSIYYIILELNSVPLREANITSVVNKIIPYIDENKINKEEYNGLHPSINSCKDQWMMKKENKRYLNIQMLLND